MIDLMTNRRVCNGRVCNAARSERVVASFANLAHAILWTCMLCYFLVQTDRISC